jgi:hypothetical protein
VVCAVGYIQQLKALLASSSGICCMVRWIKIGGPKFYAGEMIMPALVLGTIVIGV